VAELVHGGLGVVDLVDLGGHGSAERVGRDIAERGEGGVVIEQTDVAQPALDGGGEEPGAVASDEHCVEVVGGLGNLASA
jgi:hypothetical protein